MGRRKELRVEVVQEQTVRTPDKVFQHYFATAASEGPAYIRRESTRKKILKSSRGNNEGTYRSGEEGRGPAM